MNEESVTHVMRCIRKNCSGEILDRESLLSELKLDSLDLIESLFELENHYGKTLSNVELASLITVEDLVRVFCSSSTQL